MRQIARNQGKKIARLREGVFPNGEVLAAVEVARFDQITNIRAVIVVGYAAVAFSLALGAEVPRGLVETLQSGVLLRINTSGDPQREGVRRRC
eukprot:scaffold2956_cov390-Prasinococcus_capsulatus_cf.AAC.6